MYIVVLVYLYINQISFTEFTNHCVEAFAALTADYDSQLLNC